uniref:Plasmid stabilization system protein n=1 Tax=Caldiarchaeum subterraneum TaxID=311458 RepID=E6N7G7_CALS0|nr:plasmid stabilization system protein [Candidatus Caldarchaeum subterraneum]
MKYRVVLSRRAYRTLGTLDKTVRKRIVEKLDELGDNPYPRGCIKIHEKNDIYRIRVGDYRVLYKIDNKQTTILIIKIDHRETVYR